MSFKSPNNSEEYWLLIYNHWDNIFHILNLYLFTFQNKWIDGTKLDSPLYDYLIQLKENNNPRLIRAFNAALWNCPEENSGEWYHKGWDILNCLSLEEYVIYEPKEI